MRKTRVIVVGLALFVVATATVGGFSLFGRSDDQGGRAFYFSVATKSATGAGCFQGGCFIAMFGSGTFEGTDAQGNGIFSISTGLPPSSTNSVASGTWEVTGLVSFTSYGVANRRAEGGLLVLAVTLDFDGGADVHVTLAITCRGGNPPPRPKGTAPVAGGKFNLHTRPPG